MKSIYIYYSKIADGVDATSYLSQKLTALNAAYVKDAVPAAEAANYKLSQAQLDGLLALAQPSPSGKTPSVAQPSEFPSVDPDWQPRIDAVVACATEIIDLVNPLLPGETLSGDLATYLTKGFKGFVPGTGVIVRTTNMGVTYYLFPNTMVSSDGMLNREPPVDPGNAVSTAAKAKAMPAAAAAMPPAKLLRTPFDSLVIA